MHTPALLDHHPALAQVIFHVYLRELGRGWEHPRGLVNGWVIREIQEPVFLEYPGLVAQHSVEAPLGFLLLIALSLLLSFLPAPG